LELERVAFLVPKHRQKLRMVQDIRANRQVDYYFYGQLFLQVQIVPGSNG